MRGPGDQAPGSEPVIKESKEKTLNGVKTSIDLLIRINNDVLKGQIEGNKQTAEILVSMLEKIRSDLDLL